MSNRIIWKFEVKVEDEPIVNLPDGAVVLSVQTQNRLNTNSVQIWAICNPDAVKVPRRFVLLTTGHYINHRKIGRFIGTFQLVNGNFVGHLFEAT